MRYQTTRRPLSARWRVREAPLPGAPPSTQLDWIPAQVPGAIHLDLMREGVIPDPFSRMSERAVAWVDETSWEYEAIFSLRELPGPATFLVFEGLDTIAEINLNGEPLGRADNMFIPHEFSVDGRLKEGENTLHITFLPAKQEGRARQEAWAASGRDTLLSHWFVWGPRAFVRKAQYMFGWDWGPQLVSCGIFRPVELLTVPVARLRDFRYEVEFPSEKKALLHLEVFVERASHESRVPLTLTAHLPTVGALGSTAQSPGVAPVSAPVPQGQGQQKVALTFSIDHPRRWFPLGSGTEEIYPHLYTLDLALSAGDELVDSRRAKIGLRTIELVQEPDADGEGASFLFRINGRETFIKGANWIPADSFPARLDHESDLSAHPATLGGRDGRVYELLKYASDAGFNMLRVWGGGFYESEHFYDLCDRLGILVWQDFPYACSYYPDEGEYAEEARKEATLAVRRLRVHPSLALWCGNNENHQMHHDGWSGLNRPPRFLGEKLYHEILPEVVSQEDAGRPYLPGSPYGGENPNTAARGDRHNWDAWHGRGDWVHYLEDNARFVSEFGFASSCGLSAWEGCLALRDWQPHSGAVRWHDKTRKGYETYLGLVALHFPSPGTLEDLVYYSQLNQAEAMRCAIEHFRRQKGRCWGTLLWQHNDCWPGHSWSLIDASGEPKAAYYAVKRAYQPVLLSLVRRGQEVDVYLVNDLDVPLSGEVLLSWETFSGEVHAREYVGGRVGENGVARITSARIEMGGEEGRAVYLRAAFQPDEESTERALSASAWSCAAQAENFLFFAEPKDLLLSDPGVSFEVRDDDPECFVVKITAKRFAPYVWLRVRGRVGWGGRGDWEDNFFHLPGGASYDVTLRKTEDLKEAAYLRGRLAIRSL